MENKLEVKGIWAAVMTPFDEQGEVSESILRRFMDFFLEKELGGIFPVSNIGEFAALTFEQRCRIIEICTSRVRESVREGSQVPGLTEKFLREGRGNMKVCPGVTDLNLDRALELAEFS